MCPLQRATTNEVALLPVDDAAEAKVVSIRGAVRIDADVQISFFDV